MFFHARLWCGHSKTRYFSIIFSQDLSYYKKKPRKIWKKLQNHQKFDTYDQFPENFWVKLRNLKVLVCSLDANEALGTKIVGFFS